MVKRATKRSQTNKARNKKKVILIAAEGVNKTEKTYFNEFNSKQNKYRIIHAHGNSTDPIGIVKDVIESAKKEELDYKQGDKAFAIFDVDFGKTNQIKEALKLAKKGNVEVILSNPCFEIWLLMHFRYSTKSYASNAHVIEELVTIWPQYRKNRKSYQELDDKIAVAIKNANKLKEYFGKINGKDDVLFNNSSTDVFKIVELLVTPTNS